MPKMVCILHMYSIAPGNLRISVMIGLSLALLGGSSLALAAEVNAPQMKRGTVSTVTLSGVTFVKSRGGVSNVLLTADEAEFHTSVSRVYLQGMSVETKSDAGSKEFWLRCDRGVIELESGDFQAEGNVQGQMADGRSFQTESAQYDDELAVISTNVPVLLQEATGTLRGGGFQYWVREDRLQLTGGAVLLQSESGTNGKGGSGQ